ncbi:MAG: flagellar biosynthetic protein FliO [Sneathiella sp.]|nr:flagellar biosynthetic protein FliO [Sneathiella sp.]
MDFWLYMKYLVVLVFVLGLIGLISIVIRKFGFVPSVEKSRSKKKRLAISQMIGIDAKRRLILVRRDDKEHLILLGPNGDVLIESDISTPHLTIDEISKDDMSETETENPSGDVEPRLPRFSSLSKRREDAQ